MKEIACAQLIYEMFGRGYFSIFFNEEGAWYGNLIFRINKMECKFWSLLGKKFLGFLIAGLKTILAETSTCQDLGVTI